MKKERIIITYYGVSPELAMERVSSVIKGGKISKNKHGKNYCWLTAWGDKTRVSTRPKRKGQKVDSFIVYKSSP